MAQTTKSTGYIAGEDPATIEANRVYQDALARLSQSLDTRKNRFFDPVLLAAAQGFGAPTQTGSFGESLGIVAKNVSAAQELDLKQEQEIAQQRVAAAGKGIELQRMRARDADIVRYLKGDQAAEPTAKGPLSATPIAGPGATAVAGPSAGGLLSPKELEDFKAITAGLPKGPLNAKEEADFKAVPKADKLNVPEVRTAATSLVAGQAGALPAPAPSRQAPQGALPPVASDSEDDGGVQIMPPNPNLPTADEYVLRNRYSGKSLGELLTEGQALERKNFEVQPTGITNLRTGKFYASDATPVDVKIFAEGYNGGTFTVPKSVALQLSVLQRQDKDAEYKALADRATGRAVGRPAGAAPVAGVSVPVGKSSVSVGSSNEERALAAEQAKALAAAATAIEIENRKDFATRSKDASEMLATANVMRSFTEDPNFSKMTGVLSNEKISSGIALLIREGIGGKNFTIGIPAIEDVMRNAGLTREQQATFRTFLMYAAQMQLNAEKAMKGATSERERLILGNANISAQDTAETVLRKANLLIAKGQFDRQAARAFKASKMTADEFLDSPQYMDMYDQYFEDISGIAIGVKEYQKPAAAASAGAPAAGVPSASDPIKAAQDRVRKELNKK